MQQMLLLASLLLVYLAKTNAGTSGQAKCLIDCYVKCLNNGLRNATHCNCNPTVDQNLCSINFDESVIRNSMINDVVPVRTEYLNSRNIRIQMDDENNANAFVYIFEYSTVNTAPDNWIFAGVNSSADITFTIADSCRDYQFRVIVILKSDEDRWLFVYRPRIIPVDLPTFAITPDKIKTEPPVYNADDDTVIVYISWENPIGYTDDDIYGYESPAIYPVQCNSPEAELQVPSVEINNGGGRLRISLPAEVLDDKCRVWAEVQMLPRCIRLEPFSIQQSFELDCDKLTDFEVCKHEVLPQCTDIIDIWGYGNNATIVWSLPDDYDVPLYYHIRYGPAKMQGSIPIASWTIASLNELRVNGNQTKLELQLDPDIDYGIQICGIYSEHRTKPKFELMHVIPFMCTSCTVTPAESLGRCGECSKIEVQQGCNPKSGIGCNLATTSRNRNFNTVSSGKGQGLSINALTVRPSEIFIDSQSENTNIAVHASQDLKTSVQQQSTTTKILEVSQTTSGPMNAISFSNDDVIASIDSLTETQKATTSTSKMSTSSQQAVPNKEKLQSNLNSCTLANGIICEFGCIDATTCNCPQDITILMSNGACFTQFNHTLRYVCFSTNDLTALWNPWMRTVTVQNKKIYNEITMHSHYDRVFMQFGHIKLTTNGQHSSNEIIFDEENELTNKVVIRTNKILQNGIFLTAPYLLYTNQTIDPEKRQYGLRICAFNNSAIKNPFAMNWAEGTKQSISQINAIQFEHNSVSNVVHNERKQMAKMASVLIPVILIVLVVILLAFIIYMNCTRLKRCYDRRKIRNFRPFAWNSNIPPMMANGVVRKKHCTVITKSTF